MTSAARQRLQALSQQLVEGIPDAGTFEDIPKIRQVAGDSVGPRVKDKVAIITGANSPLGIGRATAHQYAHNGARAIYLCDFDTSHLETHKRELNTLYPSVEIHTRSFDAADEAAVKSVVDDAITTYNRLDIFFANAGIVGQPKVFTEVSGEEFAETLRVNTVGVFLAAKYAAIAMNKTSKEKPYPSGSIIGTASVAGLRSNAGSTDYSASKAGVVSIAQTVAFQLAGTGIRINAICPGVIETGMTAPMYSAARARGTERKIGQLNPLQRGAVSDEVARVALFLGSDESSYVNGQAWAVCGGLSAGHPFVPGKLA
ncbi:Putative 3-oxoacyl-[acyl-carrier-protein] reductase [Aspergillus calidoustus]|uniref:Putative 3-oxoacyl-[acyl-carrier-protein] reductase n=1 Tax=Aspergillus calidoustus TaxID=454130 RepID=A0A0U5G160_ASPCI|nr:Putative 3-oxoacyl-[acyl-carrier-protein] reductase [Aspergillus calidoustus]